MLARRDRILVVGCGSIGRRHARNLRAANELSTILAYDVDRSRSATMAKELGVTNIDTLDDLQDVDAALICTSSSHHLDAAEASLRRNAHLFIEKPIADREDGVARLLGRADAARRVVMVGFNMRFHPCLQRIKTLIDDGIVGQVISARVQFGQYLPDWHPWEDYRRGYSANRKLGGGIILDRIHELDYIRWFLGEPTQVTCVGGKLSGLEIDTEDCVEIILRFPNGAIADVHLDYVQRAYASTCQIIGELGTITWNEDDHCVRLLTASTRQWQEWTEPAGFDFNETYVQELRTFLEAIEGRAEPPVNGRDGLRVLQIALAAKQSMSEGRTIAL